MGAIAYVPLETATFLFNTLDDDASGNISLSEFYDFIDVLTLGFKKVRNQVRFAQQLMLSPSQAHAHVGATRGG